MDHVVTPRTKERADSFWKTPAAKVVRTSDAGRTLQATRTLLPGCVVATMHPRTQVELGRAGCTVEYLQYCVGGPGTGGTAGVYTVPCNVAELCAGAANIPASDAALINDVVKLAQLLDGLCRYVDGGPTPFGANWDAFCPKLPNSRLVDCDGVTLAVVTRPVAVGEEIVCAYGGTYWCHCIATGAIAAAPSTAVWAAQELCLINDIALPMPPHTVAMSVPRCKGDPQYTMLRGLREDAVDSPLGSIAKLRGAVYRVHLCRRPGTPRGRPALTGGGAQGDESPFFRAQLLRIVVGVVTQHAGFCGVNAPDVAAAVWHVAKHQKLTGFVDEVISTGARTGNFAELLRPSAAAGSDKLAAAFPWLLPHPFLAALFCLVWDCTSMQSYALRV